MATFPIRPLRSAPVIMVEPTEYGNGLDTTVYLRRTRDSPSCRSMVMHPHGARSSLPRTERSLPRLGVLHHRYVKLAA